MRVGTNTGRDLNSPDFKSTAAALGRAYPGGSEAFVAAMNRKAIELGIWNTRFVDPTGLSRENASTAHDLVKMVRGAYQYP